jgi:hypothetical protein
MVGGVLLAETVIFEAILSGLNNLEKNCELNLFEGFSELFFGYFVHFLESLSQTGVKVILNAIVSSILKNRLLPMHLSGNDGPLVSHFIV